MSYTQNFLIPLGAAATGLTLKATLIGLDNKVVFQNQTGVFEIGSGFYQWNYASFVAAQRGSIVFHTGTYNGSANGSTWVESYSGGGVTKAIATLQAMDEFSVSVTLGAGAITSTVIADGAITSAKISVGTVDATSTGIFERITWLIKRFWNKTKVPHKLTSTPKTVIVYDDDNTTPLTTQSISDDGTDQILTKVS